MNMYYVNVLFVRFSIASVDKNKRFWTNLIFFKTSNTLVESVHRFNTVIIVKSIRNLSLNSKSQPQSIWMRCQNNTYQHISYTSITHDHIIFPSFSSINYVRLFIVFIFFCLTFLSHPDEMWIINLSLYYMRTPHSTAYIDGRVICQRMNCTLIKLKITAIVCIRGVFYHVIGPTILSQKGNPAVLCN